MFIKYNFMSLILKAYHVCSKCNLIMELNQFSKLILCNFCIIDFIMIKQSFKDNHLLVIENTNVTIASYMILKLK